MTFYYGRQLSTKTYIEIQDDFDTKIPALTLTLVFSLWIGFRPVHGIFGDTVNYARIFYQIKYEGTLSHISNDEFLWELLVKNCARYTDLDIYFFIVACFYFGFIFLASVRFANRNALICMLFIMGTFSTFSYSVNGIRNGMACSIVLFVISLMDGNKINYIIAAILGFIAINIHKSTMIPLLMMVISWRFIKSFHWAYGFWIFSIILSLVAGGFFMNFFGSLGLDGRESYLTTAPKEGTFSHTGFRFDFLLYSMMPIVLGYYIVIKRGVQDKMYLLILNTYTLSNAFWVIVIRANYSNRFAYLSWFMYGLVLAYPLLKLDIWGNRQGIVLKNIMWAQIAFTLVMQFVYW